jgi:endonuclease YncB( thermonuclease family)
MHTSTRYILLTVFLVTSWTCVAENHGSAADPRSGYFYGRATKVVDGDTLAVKTFDGRGIRVRVAEIDAPEQGKPFSRRARESLNDLVWNKDLAIRLYDVDKYGRIVGHVFVGDKDVGSELVRNGLAVVYRRHATDQSLYELENEARAAQRAIWSQNQIPRGAGGRSAGRFETSPRVCGDKYFCTQMESCAEALFYLRKCDLTMLDWDRDGLPCENQHCKN